ncbi:hypothetical protein [Rhodococcus rhodochrous]|uniref:hypothetical protein n=1 Tax=Rhodococcus rhodochrous TaxID=1829 RepID=UPI0024BBC59A|nr:hypothetical protein [Rhodococcus rhodochrous]MDJ0401375.1 hypothetical protein [Rhodococcus rhodochrous]
MTGVDAAHHSPSTIDLDGRVFAETSNSFTGQVHGATRVRYHQDNAVLWADYDRHTRR